MRSRPACNRSNANSVRNITVTCGWLKCSAVSENTEVWSNASEIRTQTRGRTPAGRASRAATATAAAISATCSTITDLVKGTGPTCGVRKDSNLAQIGG